MSSVFLNREEIILLHSSFLDKCVCDGIFSFAFYYVYFGENLLKVAHLFHCVCGR